MRLEFARNAELFAKVAIFAVAAAGLLSSASQAHEWYGKRRDPIFSTTTCCGGSDCAPLPSHAMRNTPEGLLISLTLEEAKRINPRRTQPFSVLIDYNRIQVSEDGMPHICLQPYDKPEDLRNGYYCVFLPPNG